MALRYYKRITQNSPNVTLGNRSVVGFTSLNGVVGYFATDNEYIHQQFEEMTRDKRGGITEIGAEEFVRDYVEKKTPENSNHSSKPWREEIANGQIRNSVMSRIGQEDVQNAVALGRQPVPDATIADAPPGTPAPKKDFTPPVGRRKKASP